MQKRMPLKNHLQEIQLVTRRTIIACIFIALMTCLLIARLAYLQIYKQNMYTTLSEKNWLDLVPLEPTRGLIYDRHGKLLAENIPVFSLDVIPYQVDNMKKTLANLSQIIELNDTDISQFQRQLKQHRRFDEVQLKLRLTDAEVARFAEDQYRFPGVMIKARLMRSYPMRESFSHVLGYVGRMNAQDLAHIDAVNYSASNYIGKLGIEKYYENELHGKVGYEETENDASGRSVRVLNHIKPIPGNNIYLTIDAGLQLAVEQAFQGYRGAAIVIEPATGQILAMVSEPSYDPNIFISGIGHQEYQELQNLPDKPLYNRALRGLYPPGSTVKPFIALAALESGVTTESESIHDPGWFQLKNSEHIFRDHQPGGHGIVNLRRAITVSCDIYFYTLATKLGIGRIDDILGNFGFGEATGVDIEEELPGILASPEWKRRVRGARWYDGDTINSVIGQGYMQVTPLQLASAVATLANRGVRRVPTLLLGRVGMDMRYTPHAAVTDEVIHLQQPEVWEKIIADMREVIDSYEGTARRFGPHPDYSIAGKTGTAQVYYKNYLRGHGQQKVLPEKLRDHSLFMAFAPVEKPRIAVVVIVENSTDSVLIARKIFDYYLGKKPT